MASAPLRLLLVLLTLLALSGCGQKGDLYLPDRDAPAGS
ncbi:LPS translocon maturation chaperone LptM [Thiohalobacter sp.]|nr:lipoprotein [Thiohalobacter sp.]